MYNRESLLVKIAVMYYEEELTQTKIAEELSISRPTVAALLKEAKSNGIVQISISHVDTVTYSLENKLKTLYPHTTIYVAPAIDGNTNSKVGVAKTAAGLMQSLVNQNSVIGVGWGTTVAKVVNAYEHSNIPKALIIPMIGGAGVSNGRIHSNHIAFELAKKINCQIEYLYAPAMADSVEMKESFVSNQYIASVINKAKKVDIALVGIGNPFYKSNYEELNYISKGDANEMKALKIVGDLLTSFFDKKGNHVTTAISNKMLGLTLDDLKGIKSSIAVATGAHKAVPTLALLESQVLDYLVIDKALAQNILSNLNNLDNN